MATRPRRKPASPTPKRRTGARKARPDAHVGNGASHEEAGTFRAVIDAAQRKFKEARDTGPLKDMWAELRVLLRLLRAWSRGEYKHVSWRTVAIIVGALLYFLNPLDIIPDFIPVVGQLDDALVLGFVLKAVREDLVAFKAWEARRPRVAP